MEFKSSTIVLEEIYLFRRNISYTFGGMIVGQKKLFIYVKLKENDKRMVNTVSRISRDLILCLWSDFIRMAFTAGLSNNHT